MKIFILLLLCSNLAIAAERNDFHALSGAAGIAEPSFSTAVFQNPAGIKNTPSFQLNGQGGWDSSFNNPVYRGGFLYGSERYGVAAGISHSPTGNTSTSAFVGLAAEIAPLKTTLGLAGYTGISPSGGSTLNIGVLINPQESFQLGFTAMGINSGINEWGGGIRIRIERSFSLIADVATDSRFSRFNFQPGLMIASESAGLTLSYGTSPGSLQIRNGFTAGASIQIVKTVTWEAYYNQVSQIFTSISIKL